MHAPGSPPFGYVTRLRRERIRPLIDARAEKHPELAGPFHAFAEARAELRKTIATSDGGEIRLSRKAAGYIAAALGDYESHLQAVDREVEDAWRRVAETARVYATAPGKAADGAKARTLWRLFGWEGEPRQGRRFNVRNMAYDYMRLRTRQGDLVLGAEDPGAFEALSWVVVGCPKERGEALDAIRWWHNAGSPDSVAKALREFARADHHPLERCDELVAFLKQEFQSRKSSRRLLKPAFRQTPGNK